MTSFWVNQAGHIRRQQFDLVCKTGNTQKIFDDAVTVSCQSNEVARQKHLQTLDRDPSDAAGIVFVDQQGGRFRITLFGNDKISGIIDFYFACYDILAYDIAICINSWCFNEKNIFIIDRAHSMILGYSSVKILTNEETDKLQV